MSQQRPKEEWGCVGKGRHTWAVGQGQGGRSSLCLLGANCSLGARGAVLLHGVGPLTLAWAGDLLSPSIAWLLVLLPSPQHRAGSQEAGLCLESDNTDAG